MEVALEQAGSFITDHGLAIFVVVVMLLTTITFVWKPPKWFADYIERKSAASDKIAESVHMLSQSSLETQKVQAKQVELMEEIHDQVKTHSTWFDKFGAIWIAAMDRQLNGGIVDHNDAKGDA